MTRRALFLLVAVIGVLGCPPPPLPPAADGCGGACARLRACGVGRAETPGGAPCEEVCAAMEREGVSFGIACLTAAKDCGEARACR